MHPHGCMMRYTESREGTLLIAPTLLESVAPPTPKSCEDCPFGDCSFTRGRVWMYLTVRQAARRAGEPFDLVYRAEVRDSRHIDPAVRGRGGDPLHLRSIGWALDRIEQQYGRRFMHPGNASAVAEKLCDRWDESEAR